MNIASQLEQIDEYRWRIPRQEKSAMRTDVVVFATRALIKHIEQDSSLQQAANVASLPGIAGSSLAMPDIHQGYGFPIGGVAATDASEGVISPGGVGFDINCGVRLLRTGLRRDDVRERLEELVNQIYRDVPCGTGREGRISLNEKDLDEVLVKGARWMVENGYGTQHDAEHLEAGGCLADAAPDKVSERAKKRGRPQVGTLGSGNHFLEALYVERIADEEAARRLGIATDQMVILIHSGSRGLGHQVCTDYLKEIGPAMKRYGIQLPDRQLACVPVDSPEGQSYLGAMRASANFAWANRQGITHFVRQAIWKLFGKDTECSVIYDVCHNIAKFEQYQVGGQERRLLVHRKGATRAFPPGHPEVPADYREVGQPVFIPGSMGTASWVLVGQPKAMELSFGTTCHGAGRMLSRKAAKRSTSLEQIRKELDAAGVLVKSETKGGILEEIPAAYKDVDEVIEVVHNAGIAKKVARLRPMAVIKG